MGIVVQKFGGTSVRDESDRRRVTNLVAAVASRGHHPVVVVSAMGRLGDPYATDTLLGLLDPDDEGSARERDLLLACGELVSAVVVASSLRRQGFRAQAFSGGQAGICTDDNYGDARIVEVDPRHLRDLIEKGIIPIVAGFQGTSFDGSVATLGRGGSDTTAVALGAALEAEVVEIYTDVDGIKTADPRIVPEARTIAAMDYEEVFQLAHLGARVIHPRAVELARQFGVPLCVRSTFEDLPGTWVGKRVVADPWGHRRPEHAVTGITQVAGMVQWRFSVAEARTPGGITAVFEALGEAGVSVDLINLFPDHGYFCVPVESGPAVESTLAGVDVEYQKFSGRAKVSVVGSAIQGLPGVIGRVLEALAEAGIEVLQSVDSHSTISLLVHESEMSQAVASLHRKFGLDRV